jgi:outer membrane protein OmpA-like peptidoglycan-associated protein
MSTMEDARSCASAVLLGLLAWLAPAAVRADPITVKLVTSVPAGQQPRLTLTAVEAVEQVEVLLNREDGKLVDETIAGLAAGAARDVLLDGAVGKHQYSGRITFTVKGKSGTSQVAFATTVAAPLTVSIDKAKVDLAAGRLELLVSVPEGKVELTILSATDGGRLVEHQQDFAEHAAGLPLVVTWKPHAKDAEVGRVDLRVTDPAGAFQSFSLYPWSVYIPHEEVAFATDSAAIAPAETGKLEASLAKIADALAKHKDLPAIKLYIAGHTDTVGAAKYNLGLSLKRAQAIAAWFRKQGLALPIACEGFGEQALRIATPDATDEPRNRRVDYILSVEDPVLRVTDFRPQWKTVK